MANNEWGTPSKYIESARKVMGTIDTDPASNDNAQKIVKAHNFYTEQNSGLDKIWYGNIWLNPPYGRGLAKPFMEKLFGHYCNTGHEGIALTNGVHDRTWWTDTIGKICTAICLPDHRIRFINPDTGKPQSGNKYIQMFTYLGDNPEKFCDEFSQYGLCSIPHRPVTFF